MQTIDSRPLPEGFEPSKDGTYAVFTRPLETPPSDERSYRLLRLRNDMEVLVIHDPKADKAAAAMDVHVGHLSDPDNLQGLAHFLEHLLFLGTTKYPSENAYKEYLALHAGKSNASTSLEHTVYHFEVSHEHFEGALDRFSQFFVSPLFNESCTEREIKAVDFEFKRNLQLDARRNFHIGKHTSSRGHPYWHFSTGNLETLRDGPKQEGIDSRQELIKFYNTYYSSSIMKLVVLGQDSLDQLTDWVLEKFSDVKNLDISPPTFPNPPLTSKELLTTVFVKPIKDLRSLEVKFLLPDMTKYYTVHPTHYISHLIGHEGKGSILSLLKRNGWANSLSSGGSPASIGHEFFKITVDLTKDGLAHYEDIVVIIFQYLLMLRQEGVKSYIWDEIASLAATAFRFKEMVPASSYVTGVSRAMQMGYAPEWILSGSDLIRAQDPDLVMDILQKFSVDAWRGQLVTQDTTMVPGGAFTEVERWYGIEHHIEKVSPELMKRLEALEHHPDLHLPASNEYIPENFETGKVPVPVPLTHPILLKHTALTRIWHKKDDIFWIPKVNIRILFRSPMVSLSPSHQVKSMLYLELIKEALAEDVYNAALAGLSYDLDWTMDGIILELEGYNDKAPLLLQKVVQTMKTLVVQEEPFSRIKDQLERSHRDSNLSNPNIHAQYFMRYLNAERMWTFLERWDELDQITPDQIQEFYPEILARLHIEVLVHGNMEGPLAVQLGGIVENILDPKPLVPSEIVSLRSLIVPDACRAVYQRDTGSPDNLNSAVEYYIQIGTPVMARSSITTTYRTHRALVQIMAQIIQEPCFNQLRTIEQLGYIVHSWFREIGGTLGISILVQSERDPIHLENRIEHFLRSRIGSLLETQMTEEAFQKQVQSLIQKNLEKHKNLGQETDAYWEQITSGYYDFDEVQEDVKEMKKVTLEMIRAYFNEWISPDARNGKKISVHIRSLKLPPLPGTGTGAGPEAESEQEKKGDDELELREGTVMITDMVEFKAGLEMSRAPYPVVDLLRYSKL
ncbi:Metalloenzyme, LuxS/M16 peptidase-like protein [Mortierella sp. GBAus27b]|nr:Insulinase (Peptidase M16) [Mortierella sp. GBA43]KAI8362254.1 Metalloenzyme, LuxS/M16 peptidase-like protein [Mortierella sp. GBAus27b]